MRNLDAINPEFLKPSRFLRISACLPLLLSGVSLALSDTAAPSIPVSQNPITIALFLIMGISLVLMAVPSILNWGWEARYHGLSIFCVASISLLAIVPFFTFIMYGRASIGVKVLIAAAYIITHFSWCRKFTILYDRVFNDESMRAVVYQEDSDAIYYMKCGDEYLLEKNFKFSQMPKNRYFVSFILAAFLLLPAMSIVGAFVGLPFPHVFLLIAMLPVSWMSVGFTVRGFLIFYFYPGLMKKITGKKVYVDLVGKCQPIGKPMRGDMV